MSALSEAVTQDVIISLGSNINPTENLLEAVHQIGQLGEILRIASVYQNPAIGADGQLSDQPPFLNTALYLRTDLKHPALREALRQIESGMGRTRTKDKFAAREIDLDISLYGDLILQSEEIAIPDPDLTTKAHLAIPVAELVPAWVHPLTQKSMKEIAETVSNVDTLKRIEMDLTPLRDPQNNNAESG